MKATLLALGLASVATASAQTGPTLDTPTVNLKVNDRFALSPRSAEFEALGAPL